MLQHLAQHTRKPTLGFSAISVAMVQSKPCLLKAGAAEIPPKAVTPVVRRRGRDGPQADVPQWLYRRWRRPNNRTYANPNPAFRSVELHGLTRSGLIGPSTPSRYGLQGTRQ